MPASPGGVADPSSSGSRLRSPKLTRSRDADSPEEGEVASGSDDDDDAGDVPWVVDTRPRKERKRNKRSKHLSQSENDAASSSLPEFMTVDRTGSQAYKDDGQPPPHPGEGEGEGDGDAPRGDADSHDHTQHLLLPDHVKLQDQQRKRRRTSASPSRSPKPSRSPSPDTDAEGQPSKKAKAGDAKKPDGAFSPPTPCDNCASKSLECRANKEKVACNPCIRKRQPCSLSVRTRNKRSGAQASRLGSSSLCIVVLLGVV